LGETADNIVSATLAAKPLTHKWLVKKGGKCGSDRNAFETGPINHSGTSPGIAKADVAETAYYWNQLRIVNCRD
jgi:hypothetical protein